MLDLGLARRALVAASLALIASSCGVSAPTTPCMKMSGPSALVSGAKLFRVDVYDANAPCVNDDVPPGAGTLLVSKTFSPGQKIAIDVAPGKHTVVLTTFSDSAGTMELGRSCSFVDLVAGAQFCLDVTLHEPPDLAVPDFAEPVDAAEKPDLAGEKCARDSDCLGDAAMTATPKCDTTKHECVQCLSSSDCKVGLTCCGGACVDIKTDANNCSACGHACVGASPDCCNSACTNLATDTSNCGACGTICSTANATATCASRVCTWNCASGFQHCAMGNTGCETATNTLSNCGGCGNVCNPMNATNVTCDGTTCSYTCKPGFADCVTTAPNTGGCATNLAGTNQKLCGATCVPATSCCSAGDCTTPPGPAICFNAATCSGVGGTCNYPLKGTAKLCGSTCCNAINGSCSASCVLTCTAGFADCNHDASDGCEVNLTATNQKLCGTTCVGASTCCGAGDCTSTPTPTACFTPTCSGAGGTCSYPQKTGSQICGATCCLPINGTCNAGSCTLTCASGFCDSDGNRANGCEAQTNTVTNCAACGNVCDMLTSTGASCNGTTCLYTGCSANHVNCDNTAPDTNGCECAGTGCCGTACQTQHNNGAGGFYYDCTALGTYNSTQATEAASSDTSQPGSPTAASCTIGSDTINVVCKPQKNFMSGMCSCWAYSATGAQANVVGLVDISPNGCFCPVTGDPAWN